MPEDEIETPARNATHSVAGGYIQKSREEAERLNSDVKDFAVFDLNHIPEKPLIREEVKKIIDVFVRYHQTGIPRHLLIAGARGSGKTLTLKYLARTFSGMIKRSTTGGAYETEAELGVGNGIHSVWPSWGWRGGAESRRRLRIREKRHFRILSVQF